MNHAGDMERHFESDMATLQEKLLFMASHAERAVRQAIEALSSRNDALSEAVKESDDVLDRLEVEIDDLAVSLLARAPLASDLRLVTVAMRISQNLERVGDEATKIAKRVLQLNSDLPLKAAVEIPPLADMALDLLKEALDTFSRRDSARARAIIQKDKVIDELNRRIHQKLVDLMTSDVSTIVRCLHLMVIAKSLERIGDHAKNIAEEVVYLCEALDIRHPASTGQSGV